MAKFAVEVWTFPTDGDEEPVTEEMVEVELFGSEQEAMKWAWRQMEAGFFTRMWRR